MVINNRSTGVISTYVAYITLSTYYMQNTMIGRQKGFFRGIKEFPYQALSNMRYCGHLYSPLFVLQTCCSHRGIKTLCRNCEQTSHLTTLTHTLLVRFNPLQGGFKLVSYLPRRCAVCCATVPDELKPLLSGQLPVHRKCHNQICNYRYTIHDFSQQDTG